MNHDLMREARIARRPFALTVLFQAAIGLTILLQAAALSRIIDAAFLRRAPLADLWGVLIALAVVIGARAALNGAAVYTAAILAATVKADLRRRLLNHLFRLGPAYTSGERTGELAITATEGIETLDAFFRDYLPALFIAALVPLLILLVVLPTDWPTFITLLLTAPLIPIFMMLIGRAAGALAKQQYHVLGRLSAHFLDVMQGLNTLKMFNRSRFQLQTIRQVTGEFRTATMDVLRVAFLSALALELLATVSVAIVAVEIGLRLIEGRIEFVNALFLLVIAPEFYQPLRTLGAKFHAGTESAAAAARLYDVLRTPLPPPPADPVPLPAALPMDIRFEAVRFTYAGAQTPALDGLSFEIRAGQRVALVGASGAGKSTTASLLLGFLRPDSGEITVGGVPLHCIDPDVWREQVAWVPQRPYLFNASIAENIRLGRPDAPLEAVIRAAEAAGAHGFISRLPGGYDAPCGERGLALSGGQAQRIALARAFLRDAPLLILDEATANLDAETEAALQTALSRLLANRTALIIAHRLKTVINADQIVVLDGGQAVQIGTHAALMSESGPYRHMIAAHGGVL